MNGQPDARPGRLWMGSRLDLRRPLRAGFLQGAMEGLVGFLVLILVSLLPLLSGTRFVLSSLAWLWLFVWPVWRIGRLPNRWWARIPLGVVRWVVLYAGLVAASQAIVWLLRPPDFFYLYRAHGSAGGVALLSLLFFGGRPLVLFGGFVARRASLYLRWQLMASHVAATALTLAMLTAVASVIATGLLISVFRPNLELMAADTASMVEKASVQAGRGRTVDPVASRRILNQIELGQIEPGGEPFLGGLIPKYFAPNSVGIFDLRGRTITSVGTIREKRHLAWTPSGSPADWRAMLQAVDAGRTIRLLEGKPRPGTSYSLGAAPVLNAAGRPVAVAVVEAPQLDTTPVQVAQALLALLTVSTVLVMGATAVPVVGLAALFSYLLARRMTQNFESVTRVTTAIAEGDLTRRVPIRTRTEVGRLAESVNRMAERLEGTMDDLRGARNEAESALRTRQELVANISHELRTPLAVVRAHLDTLALAQGTIGDDSSIPVPMETLRALQHETERLAALIDDLFALSRAQAGALPIHSAPIDVGSIVDDVAAVMGPLAEREGFISLSVHAPPGLPRAMADGERLRQILSNLVRNAVRHTPEGGIIALSVERQDDWIVLAVADTGEGIADEHLPHIFERFYRTDEARGRQTGGAGLGLAIVREFVELMGGRVDVESKQGEGSCFRVYLPVAKQSADVLVPVEHTP